MISFDGWSVGIVYCVKIFTDFIFSMFMILRASKKGVKLLYLPAILMLAVAFSYIALVTDFFQILITGNNIHFTYLTFLHMTFWNTVSGMAIGVLGIEIIFSEARKRIALILMAIFGISYFITAFFTSNFGFSLTYPSSHGENIIKQYYATTSPMFYLSIFFGVFELIVAIKIFTKSFKVKGKLRLKFQMLSIGFIGAITFMYVTFFTQTIEFIYGIMLLGSGFLGWYPLYYGLTPVKVMKTKKMKTPSKSELKLVSYLMEKPSSNQSLEGEHLYANNLNQNILVFMSYATKDADLFKIKNIAERLTKFAEVEDVLYWQEDMEDNIFEYMNDNLGRCDIFILFCSKNAMDSVPVKKEWTAADAIGKPIIPVFFNPEHIPPLLRSRLGIEFDFYDLERNVKGLHSLILKKCSGLTED